MSAPLESTKYFVLLALAAGPQHGAAVREQLTGDTSGGYLRDSTLYLTLKSLLRDGYIEAAATSDKQRRPYQLTNKGRRILELEARTHKHAAALAHQRLQLH